MPSGTLLALHFSMNAQDAIGPPVTFVVHGRAAVASASPLSGPDSGGTLVTFTGADFGNGSDYRCRFGTGPKVDEAADAAANVVHATFDEVSHTIRCATPAVAQADGGSALYLSLNGQNFVEAVVAPATAPLAFHFLPALAPQAVSPSSGPSDGATLVTGARGSSGIHITRTQAPTLRASAVSRCGAHVPTQHEPTAPRAVMRAFASLDDRQRHPRGRPQLQVRHCRRTCDMDPARAQVPVGRDALRVAVCVPGAGVRRVCAARG
eukprot:6322026-Prymnesium_polylepis.1